MHTTDETMHQNENDSNTQLALVFPSINSNQTIARKVDYQCVDLPIPTTDGSMQNVELLITNQAIESFKVIRRSVKVYIETLVQENIDFFNCHRRILDDDDDESIQWDIIDKNLIKERRKYLEQLDMYKTYDNNHPFIQRIIIQIFHDYVETYFQDKKNHITKQLLIEAIEKNDFFTYFIKAYTQANNFYRILNRHLALYILDYFESDSYLSINNYRLINCLGHIVTLLIHHPNIDDYKYQGITYRGVLMRDKQLRQYLVGCQVLNRPFVSTSKSQSVAEMFCVTERVEKSSKFISVLFKYSIKRTRTAIYIGGLSKIETEEEVLILPFSLFRITRCSYNKELVEIELEECEDEKEDEDLNCSELEQQPLTDTQSKKRQKTKSKCLYPIIAMSTIAILIILIVLISKLWIKPPPKPSENVSNTTILSKYTSAMPTIPFTTRRTTTISTSISTTTISTATTATSASTTVTSTSTSTSISTTTTTTTTTSTTVTSTSTTTSTTTTMSTTTATAIITQKSVQLSPPRPNLQPTTRWRSNAITVAQSSSFQNRNLYAFSFEVEDDRTMIIADLLEHRILEWKPNAHTGEVIAGGNGKGRRADQLDAPMDLYIYKRVEQIIICDRGNRRIVQWPRHAGTSGETIISNIRCFGITMDSEEFLYVADVENHEVRRWKIGENNGILVAGGNGQGKNLNQLNGPHYIFVDHYQSVFVSDYYNNRVVKWIKDGQEGIIVAGSPSSRKSLDNPEGLYVDHWGTIYVSDGGHRVTRWINGSIFGENIAGSERFGDQSNELNGPRDIAFDLDGNLYVADYDNYRIQKFSILK